jgi:DNA-binding NarL/FixJ family response regulator
MEDSPSAGEAPIRVLLVDDHPVLRQGLRSLLGRQRDICVVGEAGDGLAALQEVAVLKPDVVIMDLALPRLSGVEATGWIKAICPDVEVLALTGCQQRGYVPLLLAAGAAGYLLKGGRAEDLPRAIRTVAAGGCYLDPALDPSSLAQS